MSDKNAFQTLFSVVADGLPTVKFRGQEFKIRPIGPEFLGVATANARARAQELIGTLPDGTKEQPADQELAASWIEKFGENGKEVAALFGFNNAKTQFDLNVAIFTMLAFQNYQLALSVVDMNGNEPNASELVTLARVIGSEKEFAKLISDAKAEIEGTKNAETPPLMP